MITLLLVFLLSLAVILIVGCTQPKSAKDKKLVSIESQPFVYMEDATLPLPQIVGIYSDGSQSEIPYTEFFYQADKVFVFEQSIIATDPNEYFQDTLQIRHKQDSTIEYSIEIERQYVQLEKINLSTPINNIVQRGETIELVVEFAPQNASDRQIEYKTSNDITINNNTITISNSANLGTTTITASINTRQGIKTASLQLDIQQPIAISTQQDLQNITSNQSYSLSNDLYLQDFQPIQNFSGVLDGNGYTIFDLNLSITKLLSMDTKVGLFATITQAKISNLIFANAKIIGDLSPSTYTLSVGILAGTVNDSTVNNVQVIADIQIAVSSKVSVGALIGESQSTTIRDANIQSNISANGNIGGLIGQGQNIQIYSTSVQNSQLTYDLFAENKSVGGLVGMLTEQSILQSSQIINSEIIYNSSAEMTESAIQPNLGYLVGDLDRSTLQNNHIVESHFVNKGNLSDSVVNGTSKHDQTRFIFNGTDGAFGRLNGGLNDFQDWITIRTDTHVINDGGFGRDEIDFSKFETYVNELKRAGYNRVTLQVKLQAREVQDGYQDISLWAGNETNFGSKKLFSHSWQAPNSQWRELNLQHTENNLNSFPVNKFWIHYDAHGVGADTWECKDIQIKYQFFK